MLFETHCHLNHHRFDDDRDPVTARARAAGVSEFAVIGFDLPSSRWAVELADPDAGIYATVGIHPHDASTWNAAAAAELRSLARRPGVVAIGEIGLDFYRNLSPQEQQYPAFREQAEMAIELDLPIIVHTRDSIPETLELLEPLADSGLRGVLHCWSGTVAEAGRALAMGFHLGIGGVVTYRNSGELADAVIQAPLERLLLETDCPYLTPMPHRGKRNEPAYLPLVAQRVAELRRLGPDSVAAATRANALRLFRINRD